MFTIVTPFIERFEAKYIPEPNSGCWLWTAFCTPRGYARLWDYEAGRDRLAYLMAYERFVGPVPKGLELDHKCRVTCCVNPAHLEPVTHLENMRRSQVGLIRRKKSLARTVCRNGHPLDEANRRIEKSRRVSCRVCDREKMRRLRASWKANAVKGSFSYTRG